MKLFEQEQRSLFGEILDWMLTPLLLLWPVSLVLTWLVAQSIADRPFDRALENHATALSRQLRQQGNRVSFNLSESAGEILRSDSADLVVYQVLGQRGEFLSGERQLPVPPSDEEVTPDLVRLRDDVYRDEDVRVAYLWVVLQPDTRPVLVQVAETREKRSVLATEIIKGVMLPQFVSLPLAVLLVWLALARGIKPLNVLVERIRARKPQDLSPLDTTAVPQEVAPLVASVNELLERLRESLDIQRRFLADAAHQLKTPLAGLRMQADLALRRSNSAEELKQSLQQIGRSSMRATHTVNQLLALARAESVGSTLARGPCNLVELTLDVMQDSYPRAADKHLDLGYDGAPPEAPDVWVQGNATLLTEMIRNLIDNAINYTPSSSPQPGVVTVRVLPQMAAGTVVWQVEDSGPGIPESERTLIFDPFYRALGTGTDGSGLGLAIVAQLARQHSATITVCDARPGQTPPGACFALRFAALDSSANGLSGPSELA